jgi:DNA-binding response OmpR family regulator
VGAFRFNKEFAMAQIVPQQTELTTHSPTILVVEPEFMLRAMLSDYLQECGFKVLVANDAAQAIAIIEQSEVDVVFSNVSLPGETKGFAFARWIRENKPGVRVLLGSGDHEKSEIAKDLCENGPNHQSPYDLKTVVAKIRAILAEMKL